MYFNIFVWLFPEIIIFIVTMLMFYITILLRVPLCQDTKGDESCTVKVRT